MSADWPIVTLKEAGIGLIDCDHKTPKEQDGGFPYVGIPQLRDGRIVLDGVKLISEEDFHHWRRKAKPLPNDVILSRRCNPGEIAYVPTNLDIALGQNLVLLRSDGVKVFPPFLRWITQGTNWWNQVKKYINVGAIFDSLKCAEIPKFEFKLPPMDEQKRISKILEDLDKKVEINHQTAQTLEQIAQTVFKSWFVDFEPTKAKVCAKENRQDPGRAAMAIMSGKSLKELDLLCQEQQESLHISASLFPESLMDSGLGEIPEGWAETPLYETAEYVNGGAFRAADFCESGEGLPIIKIAELKQGIYDGTKFTLKNVKERHFITNDDVLYSWSGSPETSLEVFKWFGGDGWLNQHIFKLNFESQEKKYFTYYLLKHMKPVLIATAQHKQTTGLGHITVADMKRLLVAYPSVEILERFRELVGPIYDKCSIIEKENIELISLRDTLLPKLLSGELFIQEAEQNNKAIA